MLQKELWSVLFFAVYVGTEFAFNDKMKDCTRYTRATPKAGSENKILNLEKTNWPN